MHTVASHSAGSGARSPRLWSLFALLLFALALVPRFAYFDAIEFGGDECDAILAAVRALEHGGTSHGVSASVGLLLPPFYMYLLMVPVAVTRDPLLVTGFFALLNVGGLVLLFAFARRLWGVRSAALMVLILAAAPWATVYSRKIWNPDVLFPLAAAFYWALFATLAEYRRGRVVLTFLFFGLLEQIHPSAWFLVPPLVLFLALFRPKLAPRDVLLGCLLVLVLLSPWFYYLASTGFDDLAKLWSIRSRPQPPGPPTGELLLAHVKTSIDLAGGTGFDFLLGPEGLAVLLARPAAPVLAAVLRGIAALEALATAAAIVWAAFRIRDSLRGVALPLGDQALVLFALIYVCMIGAYTLLAIPPVPHYHVILYPIVAVFTVWFLERALALAGERGARLALPAVALIVLAGAGWSLSFQSLATRDPSALGGKFAPPYGPSREQWAAAIAHGLDEIEHGAERYAAHQAELAARFEAADRVLLRYDPARNEPAIEPRGGMKLEPTAEGLVARGGSPHDLLLLPGFESPSERGVLVRLEISLPRDYWFLFFFQTAGELRYSGRQATYTRLLAGRHAVYVEIDEPDLVGQMLMRLDVHRYVVHALEVRASGG